MNERSPLPGTREAAADAPAGTVWVDVTTLLRWHRPAVGVVRVEHQLVRWILAHDERVRFCRYDKTARAIVDVDRPQVVAQIDFLDRVGHAAPTVPQAKPKRPKNAL